jgi:hypothetical protein
MAGNEYVSMYRCIDVSMYRYGNEGSDVNTAKTTNRLQAVLIVDDALKSSFSISAFDHLRLDSG